MGFGMRTIQALTLALAFFSAASFAQGEVETAPAVFPYDGTVYATAAEYCTVRYAAMSGGFPGTWSNGGPVGTGGTAPMLTYNCMVNRSGDSPLVLVPVTASCPATYSANTTTGQCERPMTCAGKAGTSKKQNFTVGWQRSNDPDSYDFAIGPAWPPLQSCIGGCLAERQPNTASASWVSQHTASNGLHRVSVDMLATFTGGTCSGTDAPADPASPVPPCPGVLASIDGKPACVGTPSTPLPAAPRPPEMPSPAPGNPSAGPAPATGPGSGTDGPGRSPTVGSGGPGGGGSNSAVPGGGSDGNGQGDGTGNGTVGGGGSNVNPDGTERETKDPCGLPGTPPCKLDETGTPANSSLDAAANAAKTAGDALIPAVSGVQKPSDLGWSFGFSLPVGSCTDFQMYKPGGSWGIGLCENAYVEVIRQLLAWAMGILAAVYCYRSVTRTIAHQE